MNGRNADFVADTFISRSRRRSFVVLRSLEVATQAQVGRALNSKYKYHLCILLYVEVVKEDVIVEL